MSANVWFWRHGVGASGSSRDSQASQPSTSQVNRVAIRLIRNTCAGRTDYKRAALSNLQCLNVLNQAGTSSDEPFATTLLKVIRLSLDCLP